MAFSRARSSLSAALLLLGACSGATGLEGQVGGMPAANPGPGADACAGLGLPILARLNPTTGDSFYTADAAEAAKAAGQGFTQDEGTAFRASGSAGTGWPAFHRLVHVAKQDHVWSADASEQARLEGAGYVDEGVSFYAPTSVASCTVPVLRLVNTGLVKHRLVVTSAERDALLAQGWQDEGPKFYARPGDAATPTPNPSPSPSPAPAPAPSPSPSPSPSPTPPPAPPPPPPPPPAPVPPSPFTLAVMPDTQREVNSDAAKAARFTNRIQYLVDHRAALNLQFVMQVGDLVDWDTPDHIMYTRVSTDLKLLENAKIPYAVTIGNHDTAAVGVGGSACGGCTGAQVHANLRVTTTFNSYFPLSRFSALQGTYENGKIDNAYYTFSAGGLNWLVLSLELWPRTGVVAWARGVVSSHPKHNVIIATHSYLNSTGGIEPTNGGYGDNSPQYVFDNLIKLYPNVLFVFSGHVGTTGYRVDTGVNGNKIYNILQCYHDEITNPSRLITVDPAKGTATTKVYGAWTNETKADGSAFTIQGITFVQK